MNTDYTLVIIKGAIQKRIDKLEKENIGVNTGDIIGMKDKNRNDIEAAHLKGLMFLIDNLPVS